MERIKKEKNVDSRQTNRIKLIDVLKGILIILVVYAHYKENTAHYIIFLFHMPLFFMISGFLLTREKAVSVSYISRKVKFLSLPYFCYFVLEWLSKRDFSFVSFGRLLWGGRSISWGVYWYITCLIAALFIFCFLLRNFSDRVTNAGF